MFNGIIFNKGVIKEIFKRPKGINIFVKSDIKLSRKDIGISVACDGVCLTLITIKSPTEAYRLFDPPKTLIHSTLFAPVLSATINSVCTCIIILIPAKFSFLILVLTQ